MPEDVAAACPLDRKISNGEPLLRVTTNGGTVETPAERGLQEIEQMGVIGTGVRPCPKLLVTVVVSLPEPHRQGPWPHAVKET
jgi:hypothetical protein